MIRARFEHWRVKGVLALLALGLSAVPARSFSPQLVTAISGDVVDPVGAVIPKALVVVRNEANGASATVATDVHGRFAITGLDAGDYVVKVRSPGFETFSRAKLHLDSGSRIALKIQLEVCQTHHLGKDVPNFSTIVERKVKSDAEEALVAQAEALSCTPEVGSTSARRPNCANIEAMQYYFRLVKENEQGLLPEDGEGPVEARAYYGALVEFDGIAKRWIVELTLEYAIQCGMLCGEGVTHTRQVIFDQQKNVVKVEDDPDGACGWVS